MKLKEALGNVQQCLTDAQNSEAQLEAELLLRYVLRQTATELFLNYDHEISDNEQSTLQSLLFRRLNGEPLAYIIGQREFYGLDFIVNSHVLIPRPETEHLVEKAIEIAKGLPNLVIADIGTGSGAIAVTLAVRLPHSHIYAVDISPKALGVARTNATQHCVTSRITFIQGNLLEPVPQAIDLLVANLPYVKSSDCISSHEPHLALDGGENGLDAIKHLCATLEGKIRHGGSVLLEIGYGQAENVIQLLRSSIPVVYIETIKDLAGIERVVWGRL